VITFGPGDDAFLRFGHNAIRVEDPQTGADLVYNFGTFRFDNPTLILDFLTGKFRYWLSVVPFSGTVQRYKRENRDVIVQELALSPRAAFEMNAALRENAMPENRDYLYDYYRDNCSTRVRDAVDVALGGALRTGTQDPGEMTLREHTLRAVAHDFWLYLGLDIAMGAYIDQPETRWSEMFLPEKLHDGLASLSDAAAAPIVRRRDVVYEAVARDGIAAKPPNRLLQFLLFGIGLGCVFALLGSVSRRRSSRALRAAFSVLLGVFGLVLGVLGSLFSGLWLLTNHEVAFRNENILLCPPFALAQVVTSVGLALDRPRELCCDIFP
jgi:hypothetical protein